MAPVDGPYFRHMLLHVGTRRVRSFCLCQADRKQFWMRADRENVVVVLCDGTPKTTFIVRTVMQLIAMFLTRRAHRPGFSVLAIADGLFSHIPTKSRYNSGCMAILREATVASHPCRAVPKLAAYASGRRRRHQGRAATGGKASAAETCNIDANDSAAFSG